MQNVTPLYEEIYGQDHVKEVKLSVDGVDYGIDKLVAIETSGAVFGTDAPMMGLAVSREIDTELLTESSTIPRMAELIPYIRLKARTELWNIYFGILTFKRGASIADDILVFTEESGVTIQDSILMLPDKYEDVVSEWIQKGVFYIDTRESTPEGHLRIHGFDAMLKTEASYPTSSLSWPARDINVVNEIARTIGVEVDSRTTALINQGFSIPFPPQYTMREVLKGIAGLYGGSFYINDLGKLQLICFWDRAEETFYLTNEDGDRIIVGGNRIKLDSWRWE